MKDLGINKKVLALALECEKELQDIFKEQD